MPKIGWIVQTECSGVVRYWKVGDVDAGRAANIALAAAGATSAKAIARIASEAASAFAVIPDAATEVWERKPVNAGVDALNAAEITFDCRYDDDQNYMEGCYRLPGGNWQVYYFTRAQDGKPEIRVGARWQSGITGVNVHHPRDAKLNKTVVKQVLGDALGISTWEEVPGPNSLVLK